MTDFAAHNREQDRTVEQLANSSLASRVLRWLSNLAFWFGGASLLLLALVIVIATTARTLGWVMIGSSEVVDVVIVIVASMTLIAGTAANSHPSVNILTEHLGELQQRRLKIFALLLSTAFFAALCFESARVLVDYAALGEYTQLLHITITPFRAVWVISLAIICILFLLRAWLIHRRVKSQIE